MTLSDAVRNIRAIHTDAGNLPLARAFSTFFSLHVPVIEAKTDLAQQAGLLLLFEGTGSNKSFLYTNLKKGFRINPDGEGLLYIDGSQYLFSFAEFVFQSATPTLEAQGQFFIPFHPAFKQLRTAYDYFLTQEGRVTKGLNRQTYIDALARAGVTHMEVNGLGYPMSLENGPKGETYPMFYTYCPAMDQFVHSSLNKGIYPAYYLSQNLAFLKQHADMARDRGILPGMLSFEPRSVPESFFDRYPMLRGARIDHPFRSFKPRYTMTTTHPLVLNHYWEMTQKLLQEVPDLSFFTIWSNDSGAGFEHTKSLYVGRNGGAYLVREWKGDDEIARLAGENALTFMKNILEAGREINPKFKVITRLESFYGEVETIWKGLGDGLEVETNSLVAKGWSMPYKHVTYPDISVLNGGGIHHQSLDAKEMKLNQELKAKGSAASFYFGMGPQVMFAPLMGIPYPESVWNRLKQLKDHKIEDVVIYGGTFPPEQVPYFVNYEMIRRFQYDREADCEKVIMEIADRWTKGRSAETLIQAWKLVEEALLHFPNVSTLYNTIGFTWYRIWTRPLVPNIEAIPERERAYYQDMMCTTPHNPNNVDLSRDVLFQIVPVDHCSTAVELIDSAVIPVLDEAISLLKQVVESNPQDPIPVFYDQLIRAQAVRCYVLTQRNVAAWIQGVYGYMHAANQAERNASKALLSDMMDLELNNMHDLLDLLHTDIDFIAQMESGESPLMYGRNMIDHILKKQELMQKYRDTEPYIDPDYVIKKSGELL